MFFFKKSLPTSLYCQTKLKQLPCIPVKANNYTILERPEHFHQRMLELIKAARRRITMTLLYLQDDEAGREILDALYAAQKEHPQLHIRIYVDFHRAQRGLIGQDKSAGNAALYYKKAEGCSHPPAVYGVPVKKRELFGVMHLKGCVFDDTVLYSGASVNDVYLDFNGRYRLDRYHEIVSRELADCMDDFATKAFHINFAVQDFSQGQVRPTREIKDEIKQLRRHLTEVHYNYKAGRIHDDEVGITPLVGLGKRANQLNRTILWCITAAKHEIFLCTPYFNPPKSLLVALEDALQRGVKVTIVAGDKKANDFYISDPQKFSAIGAIPYIYEQNLREFMQKYQDKVSAGELKVMLWTDGDNTYHLKGMFIDRSYALITGNNLNPRAWALDLENGLLVHDPHRLMREKFVHEQQFILRHTKRIQDFTAIDSLESYPEQVRRILEKVRRFKASLIIKQLL